jgi:hypothetical protein
MRTIANAVRGSLSESTSELTRVAVLNFEKSNFSFTISADLADDENFKINTGRIKKLKFVFS